MKLLVITREFPPHVVGGLSYHLAHLYSTCVEAGHDVTVLTGVASDATHTAADLVHPSITVQTVPYGRVSGQHLKFPLSLWRVLRSFDATAFDVALTHTPLPFELPIPTVGKYHDCPQEERQYFRQELSAIGRLADSLLNPTRRFVDRRSLQTVDHAIFNSRLCQQAWEQHYTVTTPRTVIYNGVDTDLFYPRETVPDEEYVLFVGDSERKGLSRVRQFARQTDLSVYVVGDLSDAETAFRTCGRVAPDRLAELYSGAVATIHPAQFEAFGNVVLESLACGTPVATTSQCGASEILSASCGVVDMPLDRAVERCRELEAKDCRRRAKQYTWVAITQQTIEKIDTITHQR